jgi:rhamnose utilization protein RhaD (predicted bifunctional aldolase and dehydrogenase)
MTNAILDQLVALSNTLGQPENDFAILGEGNTSARADDDTFYVKSSGSELRTIAAAGFCHVVFDRVMQLLDVDGLDDQAVKAGLQAAKVDPAAPGHPSVETLLHALCLSLPGVNFVGHTHPTAINALTCSVGFEEAFAGRLFPDEIVLCGPATVLVPYTDPGVALARKTREQIGAHIDERGEMPRVVVIQNHGLIALGRTAEQVENETRMAVKAARILLGTYAAGGPRFLSEKEIARIHNRPDEHLRREKLGF